MRMIQLNSKHLQPFRNPGSAPKCKHPYILLLYVGSIIEKIGVKF